MTDRLDLRSGTPIDGGCQECGSVCVTVSAERCAQWRLGRVAWCLVWLCGDCGARWAEPIIGPASELGGGAGTFPRPVS